MSYHYYQLGVAADEKWKPVHASKLDTIEGAMFCTILSVDSPIPDDATKEQLADTKYSGKLYFDLDDASSPASTAKYAQALIGKLEEHGVFPRQLEIYASGGKGFHILVPEECFLTKPPKAGMAFLPAIYKEMAFALAVESLDFRVYTARKGRMFRRANVERPNGLYKVRISAEELATLAEIADKDEAEATYKQMCSAPRRALDVESDLPELSTGLMALFDQSKAKVSKAANRSKKKRVVTLPKEMPSFDALLRGEGIKSDIGFHQIAMQVAITAHARNMTRDELLAAAEGLCSNHESDGYRYNTASKRRAELARMWEYTDDNPCYEYSAAAVTTLLTHTAPDMHGIVVSEEEVAEAIADREGATEEVEEFGHAGLIMTRQGAYTMTENGPKMVTAVSFDNVTELVSAEDNRVTVVEADVYVAGRRVSQGTPMELDSFNSVSSVNKLLMRHGQAFSGNDVQARGLYLRMIEKARKANRRMYVSNREGLDLIKIPGHENEAVRKGFMVWSDNRGVAVQPNITEAGVQMKFVGFPDPHGQFQTDLEDAPKLVEWLKDEDGLNKESLRVFLKDLLTCQSPSHVGKLLGWMVAAYWRMLFHEKYDKFPLLHINGAAGQGKCLGVDTPILLADGTIKKVQDVVVGDKLLGPDGTVRNVLSTVKGQEQLYRVIPVKGDPYVVNESHILSLRKSDRGNLRLAGGRVVKDGSDIVNVDVKTIYDTPAKVAIKLKGWRASELEFPVEKSELPVDPYWLGAWLGDGNSTDVAIYKPECNMTRWLSSYAQKLGMTVKCYSYEGKCPGWAITGSDRAENPLREFIKAEMQNGKRIPNAYKVASLQERLRLLAGLLDSDGHMSYSGFDWLSKDEELAKDFAFLCRSVGLAAYIQKCVKTIKSVGFTGTYWRVHVSGDCDKIPCLDKKAPPRKQVKRHLVHGITIEKLDVGDYYGFELDGDKLFLLGDFTVTHNTETTKLFCNLHYYNSEPKMLTPTSTLFAVANSIAGSASIPLVLDEFKPAEMNPQLYDKFKLLLRDAYNCRAVERGGGTRENSDYRSVHKTQLAAPLVFISEAAESESALMERVVLVTQIKPPAIQMSENYLRFSRAVEKKDLLGMMGKYIAAGIIKRTTMESFTEEFNTIYNATRKELMLSADDVDLTPEMLTKKSGAKERTVFNYSVVKFGLVKFSRLIQGIFGDEFDALFQAMQNTVCSSVDDIQAQTVPEWLKVLNTFTDMAHIDPESPCFLIKGKDYAVVDYGGAACMEFNLRSCYHKYRQYMAISRSKPLFPGESAFVFAMGNTPSLVAKAAQVELQVPGGSHVFSLSELRSNGYMAP